MEVKCFEVRDRHTFIPVIGILMMSGKEVERYLLRRAGFGETNPLVVLVRMEATGHKVQATYDPHGWQSGARTIPAAHHYIAENWARLESGAVIDVEYILGETKEPKQPERI